MNVFLSRGKEVVTIKQAAESLGYEVNALRYAASKQQDELNDETWTITGEELREAKLISADINPSSAAVTVFTPLAIEIINERSQVKSDPCYPFMICKGNKIISAGRAAEIMGCTRKAILMAYSRNTSRFKGQSFILNENEVTSCYHDSVALPGVRVFTIPGLLVLSNMLTTPEAIRYRDNHAWAEVKRRNEATPALPAPAAPEVAAGTPVLTNDTAIAALVGGITSVLADGFAQLGAGLCAELSSTLGATLSNTLGAELKRHMSEEFHRYALARDVIVAGKHVARFPGTQPPGFESIPQLALEVGLTDQMARKLIRSTDVAQVSGRKEIPQASRSEGAPDTAAVEWTHRADFLHKLAITMQTATHTDGQYWKHPDISGTRFQLSLWHPYLDDLENQPAAVQAAYSKTASALPPAQEYAEC